MRTQLASLFLGIVMLSSAWSQSQVTARLNGSVKDASGAVVPGAKVTLANPETGFRRDFTTAELGEYTFVLIPPGRYTLTANKAGFTEFRLSSFVLEVGQSSTLDVQLRVAGSAQNLEVKAAAPILDTSSADIGSEVSGTQAVSLPLNWRNVFGLVSLDSGVNNSMQNQIVNSPGAQGNVDQDIAFFNFGGTRMSTVAFLFDGHWDVAGDWGGIIFVPSVDEVQEFKIQTNSFSPQYGWGMGTVVNAVSKSGTRDFHGSLFEFLRNDKLDANNYFNNLTGLPKSAFHRNQFGFTAGGPLYIPGLYKQRDKTHIFGAYEGLRQQTPTTLVTTVPTALQRQGNFSQTLNSAGTLAVIYNPFSTQLVNGQYVRVPFPNNTIPTNLLDPVALKLLTYYPAPDTAGDPTTGANNFAATAGLPTGGDQYTIKVDHNINPKQYFFVRWSQKRQYKQLAGAFFGSNDPGGNGTKAPDNRWDIGLGYTYAFSPTLVMVVNGGWNRWTEGRQPQGVPFSPSSLGLPSALDTFGGPAAFPGITISGDASLGSGTIQGWPREARTVSTDFTKVKGSHTFSMGFMAVGNIINPYNSSQATFSFSSDFTQGPNPTAANILSGYSVASFLLGTGDSGGITLNASASVTKKFAGWYFNDDWRLAPKVTVNLGLRYDFQTAPTDRQNRLSYFNPTASNPLSSQVGMNLPGALAFTGGSNPRGVYNTPYLDFAPRIGLSYSPTQKLVLRSGFGMFYFPAFEFAMEMGLPVSGFSQTTTYVGTLDGVTPYSLLSNPFPSGLLQPTGNSLGGATYVGQTVDAVLRARSSPYLEMWTANLQYEVAPNTILKAGYVGNHGVKLPFGSTFEMDELPPSDLSLGNALLAQVKNPFYGIIKSGSLAGPTVAYGQLLRPFPEYTGVENIQPPSAFSTYNALSLSGTRRFSNGLQFLVSYTWSKFLTNSDSSGFSLALANYSIQNWYNTALEKSYAGDDIPSSLVISYVYELPIGEGKALVPKNKFLNAVIGGWQIAGISSFKDGFPLAFMDAVNNSNSFGGGQRPNLVGNPTVSNPNIYKWFNTAAFSQPAPFTFGSAPPTLGEVRAPGMNNFDATLLKNWRLWNETSKLQFRLEAYNLFNRAQFYAPGFGANAYFGSPTFGTLTAALPARSVQLGLKLYW